MRGIDKVLYRYITDDTVLELLFRYWHGDRSRDPGPAAGLLNRLIAVSDTLSTQWWNGCETTLQFHSREEEHDGVSVTAYMTFHGYATEYERHYGQSPTTTYAFSDEPSPRLLTSGEGSRTYWRQGDDQTDLAAYTAALLLERLMRSAPAQARIGGGAAASLRHWLAHHERTPCGINDYYVAADVCVAVREDWAVIFADTAEAVEKAGLHQVDGFSWICRPTMGPPETDIRRPANYRDREFASAGISLVEALSEPRLEHAFDRFADEWIGGVGNFKPEPGIPLIVSLARAIERNTPFAVDGVVPAQPGDRPWEENNYGFGHRDGLHTFLLEDFGHAIWAYDETPERRVWICRDDLPEADKWSRLDTTVTPFLFDQLLSWFQAYAPVTLYGTPPSPVAVQDLLASFTPVAPTNRAMGSDGWYATPEVFGKLRAGTIRVAARTRSAIAASSLAGWGGWHWNYDLPPAADPRGKSDYLASIAERPS